MKKKTSIKMTSLGSGMHLELLDHNSNWKTGTWSFSQRGTVGGSIASHEWAKPECSKLRTPGSRISSSINSVYPWATEFVSIGSSFLPAPKVSSNVHGQQWVQWLRTWTLKSDCCFEILTLHPLLCLVTWFFCASSSYPKMRMIMV